MIRWRKRWGWVCGRVLSLKMKRDREPLIDCHPSLQRPESQESTLGSLYFRSIAVCPFKKKSLMINLFCHLHVRISLKKQWATNRNLSVSKLFNRSKHSCTKSRLLFLHLSGKCHTHKLSALSHQKKKHERRHLTLPLHLQRADSPQASIPAFLPVPLRL